MENATQPQGKQNRLARDLDTRAVMQRPQAWRPPEVLPSPDPRPGWKHRWVRKIGRAHV